MDTYTRKKMKFSIKDFFSKCGKIRRKLRIWSHLLKKPLMENFIFLCSVFLKIDVFSSLIESGTSSIIFGAKDESFSLP